MWPLVLNLIALIFVGRVLATDLSVSVLALQELDAIVELREAAEIPAGDSWNRQWNYLGKNTRLVAFIPQSLGGVESIQITEVLWDDKPLIKEHRSLVGSKLRKVIDHGRFLFIFWGKGVHGETVVVLDMALGKIVLRKNSAWPVEFAKREGEASLKISSPGREYGEVKYTIEHFSLSSHRDMNGDEK